MVVGVRNGPVVAVTGTGVNVTTSPVGDGVTGVAVLVGVAVAVVKVKMGPLVALVIPAGVVQPAELCVT